MNNGFINSSDRFLVNALANNTESIKRLDSLFCAMTNRQEELSHSQRSLDSKFDSAIDLLTKLNVKLVETCQSMEKHFDEKINNSFITVSTQFDKKLNGLKSEQDNFNKLTYMPNINPVSVVKVSSVIITLMIIPMILGCAVMAGFDISSAGKTVVDIAVKTLGFLPKL